MTWGRAPIVAVSCVLTIEVTVLLVDRRLFPTATAVALAVVVLVWAAALRTAAAPPPPAPTPQTPHWEQVIARWHARAARLLHYADGSRADWDRHVRPVLAREFQLLIAYHPTDSGPALDELGQSYLGARLWSWVDPAATQVTASDEPGPGRPVLAEIIERLDPR